MRDLAAVAGDLPEVVQDGQVGAGRPGLAHPVDQPLLVGQGEAACHLLEAHGLELHVPGEHPIARAGEVAGAFEQAERAVEELPHLAHAPFGEGRRLVLALAEGPDHAFQGVPDALEMGGDEAEGLHLRRCRQEALHQLVLSLVEAAAQGRGRVQRGRVVLEEAPTGERQHFEGVLEHRVEQLRRGAHHDRASFVRAPNGRSGRAHREDGGRTVDDPMVSRAAGAGQEAIVVEAWAVRDSFHAVVALEGPDAGRRRLTFGGENPVAPLTPRLSVL